jgi:hypothetical protein
MCSLSPCSSNAFLLSNYPILSVFLEF